MDGRGGCPQAQLIAVSLASNRLTLDGMVTNSALRAAAASATHTVLSRPDLALIGWSSSDVRRQLQARRWQLIGRAVVMHNGTPTSAERHRAALINCGPRSVLTSFTALETLGLTGWSRPEIHVLAPVGVAAPHLSTLRVVLHRTVQPMVGDSYVGRRCHRVAPAAILAAASFATPRAGCGLLAATVQQRLARAADLSAALVAAPRVRHRAALVAATADIAMGAQALSEIDFVRLCRRYRLPPPTQQSVRVERSGRRRYLDAEWILSDGRRLVVEVDGAVHLAPRRWWDDQLRQNVLTLSGSVVLRYPSVVVRTEADLVAEQLRCLLPPKS